MADLQRVLGAMLGTGMGGRVRRGPTLGRSLGGVLGGALQGRGGGLAGGLGGALGSALGAGAARGRGPLGGGGPLGRGATAPGGLGGMLGGGGSGGNLLRGAGLAVLGALALNAWQQRQARQQRTEPDLSSGPSAASKGEAQQVPPAAPAEVGAATRELGLDDRRAHLLIRAMIAAANADGRIDAEERRRILGKLVDAGLDAEDRAFIQREMDQPASVEELARQVQGEEEAEALYLASELAIEADTPAEQSYLRYLADRLGLPRERVEELDRLVA